MAETVERPRRTGLRRVFGATSAKVGLTTVATVILVAMIGAFLLVRGYSQGMTPNVVGSTPASTQNWPVYQPIKIQFNKAMNHQSVEDNLQIWPPGERTRIPMSWDGNTLILGMNAAQSTTFLPDTTYQVMVLGSAQDAFGHQLGKTWSVSFRTSPITTTAKHATPPPGATQSAATGTQPAQTPAIGLVSPSSTPAASPTATAQQLEPTQVPGSTATSTTSTPTSTSPIVVTTPTQAATSTATPVPTEPAQGTPTAAASTPTQVATPTPIPATPQPTQAPPTPTAAAGTPTAAVVPVTGAFGSVYWANSDVQSKLGAAAGPEVFINAAELSFQRGTMYERFDTDEIYVLFANKQYAKFKDTWNPSDGEGGGAGPDQGLWIPKESFWKVWNSDPNLAGTIGYAIEQNAHLMTTSGGSFQTFANGIMLYSDRGFVYVVYNDGTWALYPDTSGHGDLITPTPETSPTPATTPAETPATTPAAATSDASASNASTSSTTPTSSSSAADTTAGSSP